MTKAQKEKMRAGVKAVIRRSILNFKRLPREARAEVALVVRRGLRFQISDEAVAWLGQLPGYPFDKAIFATIRTLEGREFPHLVITTEGPRRGLEQEASL
jgi:hypothetical protein